MSDAIELVIGECGCIPPHLRIEFPGEISVDLMCRTLSLAQVFTVRKVPLPEKKDAIQTVVGSRPHFTLDSFEGGGIGMCALEMKEVRRCATTNFPGCTILDGEPYYVHDVTARVWKKKMASKKLVVGAIGALLIRCFRDYGPVGFNEYLRRMTLPGGVLRLIDISSSGNPDQLRTTHSSRRREWENCSSGISRVSATKASIFG